ncbi:hypothetical protein F2Q69_00016370 [Brassica cretica]|uniref:DUF223 domain-containing protein n=1 Tax=Brassica cretica TaxID=69181 RepID=A0A8S9QZ62_BRACR|nr:hypothetical protein F2Q69_00016370 [Brassica cretica]
MAMKRKGKSPVSSNSDEKIMLFKDVSLGPHVAQLRFRLIHFWEARNPIKKMLIGLEMLLIDEQSELGIRDTVRFIFSENVKRFIPPRRIKKYLPDMKQGSVYQLDNFYGSKNKPVYRVADHITTVSFTWNSEMSVLHEVPISFDEDRFRFHSYEDFEANCDLKDDLYVVVGHIKLVNGHTLIERPILDEVEIATSRRIMVHVQSHDGPVMKLYFWDHATTDFCKKFNSFENTPTVLLVTTVNTKRLGGLALTQRLLSRLVKEVVTKREALTIAEIFSYMTHESAKDAFFERTATIDDVVHGSAWYRAKISVYDNSEQAFFVLLGDAGRELTGRHASELVTSYFEANEHEGADNEVPVPEALISTIGQTHKFCVKVTEHNFSGNTRAITVTKILSLDTPPPTEVSVESNIAETSEETMKTGNEVCEPSTRRGDSADEESKRNYASAEPAKAKRPRCEK